MPNGMITRFWSEQNRQVLIIGTGPQALKAADRIIDSEKKFRLMGFVDARRQGLWRYRDIPLIGNYSDIEKIIASNQIDCIASAVEPVDLLSTHTVFAAAEKMGVAVFQITQIYQPTVFRAHSKTFAGFPSIEFSSVPNNRLSIHLKKLMDKTGALVGLIMSAPLLALVSLLIKLDSPGPVLFKQMRTGINGHSFELWKFRTMTVNAEERKRELENLNEMSGPVFKIAKDPRVTKLGRFLRKYSIDELPQLFNVLRGEMSLVGPRPPLPSEVAKFDPWHYRKLSVKPGLTCLWQTNGRNNIDFEEWMKLDLKYIDNWSLWEDAKIIARTIPTVLKGSGL